MPMNYVARALEVDETRGFMKALWTAESDQILGAAVLGIEGGEIMAMLQTGHVGPLAIYCLREGIFAHPTLAESLNNLSRILPDAAAAMKLACANVSRMTAHLPCAKPFSNADLRCSAEAAKARCAWISMRIGGLLAGGAARNQKMLPSSLRCIRNTESSKRWRAISA